MTPAITQLLQRVNPEIWLVTSRSGDRHGGLIATFVQSASIVPSMPRMVVGVAKSHQTWELIEASGIFILHLLRSEQTDLVWRFGLTSGRDADKFAGLATTMGENGCRRFDDVVGWMECRVEARFDSGDRTMYLAEATAGGCADPGEPLTLKHLLTVATPTQLAELRASRHRDAELDEHAIRAWRGTL